MVLSMSRPPAPAGRLALNMTMLGASSFDPPLSPALPTSWLVNRKNAPPWIMTFQLPAERWKAGIGDESGSQLVPDPSRFARTPLNSDPPMSIRAFGSAVP
jgi:hypothetical protein